MICSIPNEYELSQDGYKLDYLMAVQRIRAALGLVVGEEVIRLYSKATLDPKEHVGAVLNGSEVKITT